LEIRLDLPGSIHESSGQTQYLPILPPRPFPEALRIRGWQDSPVFSPGGWAVEKPGFGRIPMSLEKELPCLGAESLIMLENQVVLEKDPVNGIPSQIGI